MSTRDFVRHRKAITTPLAPGSIGPYNQAILVENTLYCSGQIALDPETERVVKGGIVEQTERVLENLGMILRCAGMTYTNIVRCTIFLRDMDDYAHMNEVYSRYFTIMPPSREAAAVIGLPRGALIEISCIAIR